jgi:hypothetical protein
MPAPVITGGAEASYSIYENSVNVVLLDYSTSGGCGTAVVTIDGGVDAAKFEVVDTRQIRFIAEPDYETPLDDDEDNVYEVIVKVEDNCGSDTQTLHVTILDRDEINPTWITNPVIFGFPFPTRPTTYADYTVHRLRCSDGEVTVGTLTKNWYHADDDIGTNSVLVGTGDNYVVQDSDAGKYLRCVVTATNGAFTGDATADWQGSFWTELSTIPGVLQVHDPTTVASGSNVSAVQDLDALRGLYVFTDHTILDDNNQDMPDPPVWDESGAQADIDFGFMAVSASVGEFTRCNAKCPTLISPSFAVGAAHYQWQGDQCEFMQPDGTIVTRSCTRVLNETIWFPGNEFDDLVVYKLNSPVTTVAPAAILSDISDLEGEMALDIELDRHLTGYIVTDEGASDTLGDAPSVYLLPVSADVVDPGDSGTPVFTVISGVNVLLGCVNGAYLLGENVPNLSFFLPELATIVATGGESLTVVTLVAGGGGSLSGPAYSPVYSPVFSPTNIPAFLLGR